MAPLFLSLAARSEKMSIRELLTRKASKAIEAAVEPTKKAIQNTVEQKSDWMTKLMRFGLMGFLTLLAFREEPRAMSDRGSGEGTTVVNNIYINGERSYRHGTKPESNQKRRNDRQ